MSTQAIEISSQETFQEAPRLVVRYEKRTARRPFAGSLQILLQAILRDQRADAICLYEHVEPDSLILRASCGSRLERVGVANLQLTSSATAWLRSLERIAEIGRAQEDERVGDLPEVLLGQLKTLALAPVRHDGRLRGLITFGWAAESVETQLNTSRLQLLVEPAASLLFRSQQAQTTLRLSAEIARVENDLADLLISERARGVVNGPDWPEHSLQTLHQHVARVLDGADINRNLRDTLVDLQSRLHDRRLLTVAKAHVQRAYGLSEESAYIYLRNASRKSRRPLRDIAQEILNSESPSPEQNL